MRKRAHGKTAFGSDFCLGENDMVVLVNKDGNFVIYTGQYERQYWGIHKCTVHVLTQSGSLRKCTGVDDSDVQRKVEMAELGIGDMSLPTIEDIDTLKYLNVFDDCKNVFVGLSCKCVNEEFGLIA